MKDEMAQLILAKLGQMKEQMKDMNGKLSEVDKKVDAVDKKVDLMQSEMARHEDVLAVATILEQITLDEVAVAKEIATDKAETAYVLNKSITYGTEKRLSEQMEQGFVQVNQSFGQVDHNFEKVIGSLSHISDIMRSWVYRQSELDKELQEIKRKLNGE